MVYESDFYTTRRPYSRPSITSYSVTSSRHPRLYGMGKGQSYHHVIPFVAHKRLTVVSPPIHTVRVRPSIIIAEIDRISHKVRPSLAYQPTEDYLNSRSAVSFDDETRSIRAQTAALLKRIHEPLPRATKIFPISFNSYQEPPFPERITSDAYIHRLLGHTRNVKQEILNISHYDEPAKRLMGKGHLACVSFAGGRAFPRRKNLFYDDDRVKNDVKYLSLYKKNREAAENSTHALVSALSGDWYRKPASYTSAPRSRPISRFYRPTYVPDDNLPYYENPAPPPKRSYSSHSDSQTSAETSSTARAERQASLKEENSIEEDTEARINRRKKKRQDEARLAEEKALEEKAELENKQEASRQAELARQEKLAQEAALERQQELERKAEIARQEELARQAEEEAAKQAELERQEAERKAEAERQAELERQEAERIAEAERQAELERQEAERKAEAERQAELERQEAERKAEAERQAELERQEAERKAEEERQAEAERQAELERQAEIQRKEEEEELAKLEAEAKELEAASATEVTSDAPADEQETAPEAEHTEESEAAPKGEAEPAQEEEDRPIEAEVTSPGAEEESGPEPVVEEPLSPEAQQESSAGNTIEEVHGTRITEEEEEDDE